MYKELAKKLIPLDFKWTVEGICAVLNEIGLNEVERIDGRVSFTEEQSNGIFYDVYSEPNGQVSAVEINVEVFLDSDNLSDSQYEDMVDEYYSKFERGVREVSAVLGKPLFADGAAATGFPYDQDANWLALWMLPEKRIMLQQKHEGRDMPFRICIVIAPAL